MQINLFPPSVEKWPRATSICTELEKAMLRAASRYSRNPLACFGNEARAAFVLRASQAAPEAPYERFLARPAFEPIAFQAWPEFLARRVELKLLTGIARQLSGTPVKVRETHVFSSPGRQSGQTSRYAPPGMIAQLPERLSALEEEKYSPFSAAAFEYAQMVITHPFDDANGRVARALFQGNLARTIGFPCPLLPLGPAIYATSSSITAGLISLGRDGGSAQLLEALSQAVSISVEMLDVETNT